MTLRYCPPMATLKQLEANRLNARKSTGPRTAEGKTRSSQNALKSGIDAQAQIIHGESVDNLKSLTAEYYHRFHPTTPEQRWPSSTPSSIASGSSAASAFARPNSGSWAVNTLGRPTATSGWQYP